MVKALGVADFPQSEMVFIPLFTQCDGHACWCPRATDWRMTVISSNSVAVLSLSRSRFLYIWWCDTNCCVSNLRRASFVSVGLIDAGAVPYTAMTTIVAFASLVVAGLQPVIDFGWMMTTGIVLGFVRVHGRSRR